MAKTTSQIIAENKIKRAEAAAIAASRDKIHQQQMAGVAEKNAARTLAVLTKAISGTSDPGKKAELSKAAKSVTDEYEALSAKMKSGPKTATDMQKKKEDRIEEKNPVDSARIRKDRAQKALDDFDNNKEIDWTDTNQRKAYDAERKRLQFEVDRAGAEIDAKTHETNMEKIASMSIEDREQLQQYIESRDARRSVFANPISWYQDYNKETENKNALIEKYGEEELAKLAEIYSRHLHEQNAKKTVAETQESVNQNWIASALHNIAAVPARAMGGIESIAARLYEQVDRTGQYRTLEENTAGDALSLYGNTVSGQTAQNIAGENGGVVRGALSIGYQGIMSIVDSLARTFFGGGAAGGSALAATGSFSQTVSEATKQGASPQQAVTLGVAKAGMEYITEKIPMDEVFKVAKAGDTKVLAQAFKQVGIEVTTEELSLFGSMAAEAAILQEKSSYKQKIGDMVAQGSSYADAKAQADKDVWNEVLQTAAVSGFAGFVSGGGSALVGNLNADAAPEVTAEATQETAAEAVPAAPVVEQQAQTAPNTAPLVKGLQDLTPAPVPLTDGQRGVMAAMDGAMGVQPVQQAAVDTTPAAGYDNTISPELGASVGNTGVTYTSDNQAVPFQYAVVPAESLITSNDQFGNVNDAYPAELQPRDRTRTASQIQISKMAQNLNPALLAESATAENGAPIIRGDGVVVGGNARVNAIGMAYGSGNGGAYQQFITEKAAELGIDPATLPANPVLVRITNGVDNYTGLATALNETGVKTNSPTETAKIDASKMGDIIQYLSVGEDGDLNTAENREFIQQFTTHVVPSGEQDTVMQGNSQVSQAGVRRMQYALFHYAYNDTSLLERLAESTDNNAKNITNAMVGTAGKVAQLQTEISRGEVQDFGLQSAITNAVNLYLDAKAGKQSVSDAAGQLTMGENGPEAQYDGLTVNLALFLESNNRSGKQIRDFIDILVDVNMNMAAETATEVSMFDTGDQQTQEGLYDEAVKVYDQQRDGKGRIPEKSDFSQYRQYQPGELATELGGSGTEGSAGQTESDGRSPETVPADAPGGQRPVTVKGTGAAENNFSGKPAYNATLAADNAQADRRDDVRPMELPERDINGGNVSAVTGNVYGSKITPDDFASLMEEPTAKGDFTYAKITNDQATQRATETIASAGTWENAYDSWKQSVTSGNAGAEMSARGALFLNHAAQQGNKQLWLETLHYMQKLGTNTAQGLQAFRIIRTLQPADKIEFVRMSVEKMATEVKEKHGIDLEIDQTLIDEFENADTDEARDAVLEDIQQNVADQIPSTFLDKWTALRYMNMLGNLKTNVRNVAGNIGSAAVYKVKDTIATGMESIAHVVSGGKTDRTKSLFVRKSLLDACKKDFQQIKETVSSGGKYGERMSASSQFAQGVQDKRRIFKNPLLEGYRKGTNWMMNNKYFGDEAFGRAAYSRALAGYLQANGVTGSDLSKVDTALLDKARAYAIKEAQEATFHDNSALARVVSKVQKDTGFVGQAIMPFTKTPANILTRAEEFSPLGLINSTVKSIQKTASKTKLAEGKGMVGKWARSGSDITGADIINSWAKSITGVGLFALGAAMMEQGLLVGGPDEDDEKAEFDELNGQQSYAIRLPDGTNYTIDWLTPAAMPMFMGAQFWKLFSSDRDLTFADMEQLFTSIADPMIQMSMLQGLNDSLDGIKYSDNNLGQFFINAAVSYLTQGLTNTLLGQIERSTEENRQTTYIDKNSNVPEWLQRQLGKASQKIPGWDYQQMDYRNAWGQTEKNEGGLLYNMLSPGYVSKEQSNQITQELYRLRETTGENVFPQAVEKTITYTDVTGTKHVNHALTQTELDTIQRVEGQTAMRLLAEITGNEDYNSLTDAQRAKVISNVYEYAQEQGKKEALSGYYSEAAAWLQNMGDDAANGLIQRAALSTINSSVTKIVDNIENDWAVSPAAQKELDGLYDAYAGMSKEARKKILDEAISDTAKYLEIRSRGIDTAQYLDVVGDIKALKVEPDYSTIRDIQIREAIAENDNLSTVEKDYVMKAYMPDHDPTAKSPQKTELKYDAIRELGVSAEGYAAAYRDYLDASGSGKRRRTIAYYMKTYGWDRSTAQKVYDIYAGYYKPWE